MNTAREVSYLTEAEKQVIIVLNKARTNPPLFAEKYLAEWADKSHVAKDCYDRLKGMRPIKPLYPSKALSMAARDYVNKTYKNTESALLWTRRLESYGKWNGDIAESIFYGRRDPLEIVVQLMIRREESAMKHQENILNPLHHFVGVAMGPHNIYRYVCVAEFASDIKESGRSDRNHRGESFSASETSEILKTSEVRSDPKRD
ncbi:CAP domain-containing protein [Desulfonema magnum]|uniref:CAP domain-containing protein n=1 Tax=Desulfonema magnum TaxID=45655 RepID=UPI001A9ABD10|nr:CAP domain-containing protein [Desulfonema magnum]